MTAHAAAVRRLAALCVALVAASGAGAVPAMGAGPAPRDEVQAMLDDRSAALRAGDREAWLAAVDPEAPQAFRAAQARIFDGLRSVPVRGYALRVREEDSGDLAVAGDRYLPETRQTYRLEGYDDRDAVDTLWWTYVRRGGTWRVAADDDVADLGLETTRNIWDLGPVRVRTTSRFLLLSDPAQAARADALAALAEGAASDLAAVWTRPWSGRIPLVLPRSVDELEVLLQSTLDLDSFVAFVGYGVVQDDAFTPAAPRVYIQDRNLGRYSRSSQRRTLVHELVHAATVPLVGPAIPTWVHEGVADWVATGRRARERPPAGWHGRLPRDFEFVTGTTRDIVRAYDASRSAVSFLAARSGADAPGALLAALGRDPRPIGSSDHLVDAALREVAGVGTADFERAWSGG